MKPNLPLKEPPELFTNHSVWTAGWVPSWYGMDQDLIVGQAKNSLFFDRVPNRIIRQLAAGNKPCPMLIFNNGLLDQWESLFLLNGEILGIHHDHFGAIKSIVHERFQFRMVLESGKTIIVNTEERPGAIWDDTTEKWLPETQQVDFGDSENVVHSPENPFDWSMSVTFRILDRDPEKIFGENKIPTPF